MAAKGSVPIGIGKNSHIRRAIIDKNARIGDNVKVTNFLILLCYLQNQCNICLFFQLEIIDCGFYSQIINSDNVQEAARETEGYFIKSGIVTVIKDALIPSGTVI